MKPSKLILSFITLSTLLSPIISKGQCDKGERSLVERYSSSQNGTQSTDVGPFDASKPWLVEWKSSVYHLSIRLKRDGDRKIKGLGNGKEILPNNDGLLVTEGESEGSLLMQRSGRFNLHIFGANEKYRDGKWTWDIEIYECEKSEP
jgi:hypothetical protein